MQQELSERQFKRLGKLLSEAITNKPYPHKSEFERATVLIYNIIEADYPFDDKDLDLVIKKSGEKYTRHTKKVLREVIHVCKYLVPALKNRANKRFKVRRKSINPRRKSVQNLTAN